MKKVALAFAMLLAGTAVRADVMYWTLDFAADDTGTNPLPSEMAARLVATKDGTTTSFYGDTLGTGDDAALGGIEGGRTICSGGDGYDFASSDWSFYIELGAFDDNGVGTASYRSSAFASSALIGSIGQDPTSVMTVWNAAGGEFSAVPEPTSGVLLLVGFSGLLLRRRRIGSVF